MEEERKAGCFPTCVRGLGHSEHHGCCAVRARGGRLAICLSERGQPRHDKGSAQRQTEVCAWPLPSCGQVRDTGCAVSATTESREPTVRHFVRHTEGVLERSSREYILQKAWQFRSVGPVRKLRGTSGTSVLHLAQCCDRISRHRLERNKLTTDEFELSSKVCAKRFAHFEPPVSSKGLEKVRNKKARAKRLASAEVPFRGCSN